MKNVAFYVVAGILVLAIGVQAGTGCCEYAGNCYDSSNPDLYTPYGSICMTFKKACISKGGKFYTPPTTGSSITMYKCNAEKKCSGVEGTVIGDPHFSGFGHEKYDFMGEEGKVYSIFSEKSTQVNARMIKLDVPGEDGTYLGSCGVVYTGATGATDRVSVEAIEGSQIKVIVNGEELVVSNVTDGLKKTLPSGAHLQLLSSNNEVNDVARLTLTTMTIDFVGLGHHLDLVVEKVAAGLCSVHGVLGQTYKGLEYINGAASEAEIKLAQAKEFVIQHEKHPENDYMVSGIFATDDLFNSFGKECKTAVATLTSSRKLLTAGSSAQVCAGTNAALCSMLHNL